MTTIIIALAAALIAAAILTSALLLARRSPGDDRLTHAVGQFNDRMEAMVQELAKALERAQAETRRSRVLGELGGSIDFDEVVTRTLEAAGASPGVDAAVVSVTTGTDTPHVASVGLNVEQEGEIGVPTPPDGRLPRMVHVSFTYDPEEEAAARGGLLHEALAVPLRNDGEHVGYLTVYGRRGSDFQDAHAAELEELALRAGPAIENARRFREARQLADLDALTGLHNRRFFHETLAREVARAKRYDRSLALLVLDLDNFKAVNDRVGHLAGDAVLAEAAERVRDVVRTADVACRVGGDEFAVILPESTLVDAELLYRRLSAAVSARPVGAEASLHLSAGVTELRPEDDATVLFQRADEALYRAKDAGKGTVVAVPSRQEEPRAWTQSAGA
ncbi:MAG TPA: sensor domain-containing diguanylate cyclase [Gaiellaceae bacterium]|jgi:diguanylate cyclase (GGDEF)-like protein|nr:sensor domain-containing diguanylate cyclase [Gaiellaceae bacterium]